MSKEEEFKSVSLASLRFAHQAAAEKAIEDDKYLSIFEELDAHLAEYEARPTLKVNAIEQARAKLRMRRSA